MANDATGSSGIFRRAGSTFVGVSFLLIGFILFIARAAELLRDPYDVARVWQSFDIANELIRVHYIAWHTELSIMSGGTVPAPFLQEFPAVQYAACLIHQLARLPIPESAQLTYTFVALASAAVWVKYSLSLPTDMQVRLFTSGIIFFIPGFLRFGGMAVPDSVVFLINLIGGTLIIRGRRENKSGQIILGAALIGGAVLLKTPAFVPAALVGFALLLEKRWRATLAMLGGAIPGVLWAAIASVVNRSAVSVNEFARLGATRDWWWNPHLYQQLWWYRNITFTLYDTLGLFGVAFLIWIALSSRRRKNAQFEYILLLGPVVATFIVFNYHSATHPYYALIWLPFTMLGSVELALKTTRPAFNLRPAWPALLGVLACLAALNLVERQLAVLERVVGKPTNGPRIFSSHAKHEETSQTRLAHAALLSIKDKAQFIAYLGDDRDSFLDVGARGWFVLAPAPTVDSKLHVTPSVIHVTPTVIKEEEWRRIDVKWFDERINRGLGAVLIELNGSLDNPEILKSAKAAGLREEESHPPKGYRLLWPAFIK